MNWYEFVGCIIEQMKPHAVVIRQKNHDSRTVWEQDFLDAYGKLVEAHTMGEIMEGIRDEAVAIRERERYFKQIHPEYSDMTLVDIVNQLAEEAYH